MSAAGSQVWEPVPSSVVTSTSVPPGPVSVKVNVPSPPTAVLATVTPGRLVLTKLQEMSWPGWATNVTLLAVELITSWAAMSVHDWNCDTQSPWTVSLRV